MSEKQNMNEKDATVTVKRVHQITEVTEADHKFIIAFCLVIGYVIALVIPMLLDKTETLELVAATLSGPVGTVVGYYFGSKTNK